MKTSRLDLSDRQNVVDVNAANLDAVQIFFGGTNHAGE
jgi:hypothetical protein